MAKLTFVVGSESSEGYMPPPLDQVYSSISPQIQESTCEVPLRLPRQNDGLAFGPIPAFPDQDLTLLLNSDFLISSWFSLQ